MPLVTVIEGPIDKYQWVKIGDRLVTIAAIDLSPHTIVNQGEYGTVISFDPETFYTEIRMDNPHKGLSEWDNCLWLLPQDTPEILSALRRGVTIWMDPVQVSSLQHLVA